jgi:hypothetical protein
LALLDRRSAFPAAAGLSSFLFVISLIWTLSRVPPFAADLPLLEQRLLFRLGFWAVAGLILVGIGILLAMGMVIGPAFSLLCVSALVGLAIVLAWRRKLTRRILSLGIAAGLVSGLGTRFLGNGDQTWAIFLMITVPPTFMAGALLANHTGLGRVRLVQGETAAGLCGFLWACVLALPAAILNLIGNMQAQDTWIERGWQAFYALVPGIAEETWARLFLTTLCYALLRPTTNPRPRRAVFLAVLVGVLAHGFLHTGIDPLGILIGSLLYFLPTALLYMKYDFEHAVGYHFLVDFVRYAAAFFG